MVAKNFAQNEMKFVWHLTWDSRDGSRSVALRRKGEVKALGTVNSSIFYEINKEREVNFNKIAYL